MANEIVPVAEYEVNGIKRTITPDVVLQYMIDPREVCDQNGVCLIPPREMMKVIMTCQARNLDPFTGDVVVQPRRNKDGSYSCTLVTTKDFYVRRASANPMYDGKESGIIVLTADGRPVRREGCAVYKALGEQLLGGWCRVFVKGKEKPEYAEVAFQEYDTGRSIWAAKPATMIHKVAVSQALRAAFPNEFNGTYEPEEIGYETTVSVPSKQVIEALEDSRPWGEPAPVHKVDFSDAVIDDQAEYQKALYEARQSDAESYPTVYESPIEAEEF